MPLPDLSPPASPRHAAASDAPSHSSNAALWRGLDHAHMMQVEMVVAVLLWGGVGLLVDGWLGTRPLGIILGSLVGYAGGLYLMWLRTQRMDRDEAADAAALRLGGPDVA